MDFDTEPPGRTQLFITLGLVAAILVIALVGDLLGRFK